MSTINDIIKSAVNNVQKQSEFNVEEWAKNKQQDREFAYKKQDEMAQKIVSNGESYKTYLDVQSKFPTYSVGNALLVMAQNPQATQLKDAETWKKENVRFNGKPNKIIILEKGDIYTREDGTEAQGFEPKSVYDVSDMKVKKGLNAPPFTKENVLKGILSIAPVRVAVVPYTSNDKLVNFNSNKRTIEVDEKSDVTDTIQGLVREIASIHMLTFADGELNDFQNKSVEYMICKRYGMPTNNIDFSEIPQELKDMTPQEIKAELSKPSECFEILADGIDRTIDMQPKTRGNRENERQ